MVLLSKADSSLLIHIKNNIKKTEDCYRIDVCKLVGCWGYHHLEPFPHPDFQSFGTNDLKDANITALNSDKMISPWQSALNKGQWSIWSGLLWWLCHAPQRYHEFWRINTYKHIFKRSWSSGTAQACNLNSWEDVGLCTAISTVKNFLLHQFEAIGGIYALEHSLALYTCCVGALSYLQHVVSIFGNFMILWPCEPS